MQLSHPLGHPARVPLGDASLSDLHKARTCEDTRWRHPRTWCPLPLRSGQGTILPGVTRKSIIQLARQLGYEVREVDVPVAEAMAADEIFTTGTAVVVSAVGSLTYQVPRRRTSAAALSCGRTSASL